MLFKNLQLYRLPENWDIPAIVLAQFLARAPFVKCPSHQPISRGWVSPNNEEPLLYVQCWQWLIALRTEQRLLPASVVNQEVKERAKAMEAQQGYAPGRKQLKELKERITEEFMPRAFTQQRTNHVWIDPIHGWLGIDASSHGQAEEVIEHLRHTLDDLPLSLLHTQISPSSAMADWLAGNEAPAGFSIDRESELKSADEEKAAVRYTRHALDGEQINDEIKAHLAAGKIPTKLALTWDDRISFVLTEKGELKRLTYLDILTEKAEADPDDDQLASDFALMTGEFVRLLPQLVAILGGEVTEEESPT